VSGIEEPVGLARFLGIQVVEAGPGRAVCRLEILPHHLMSGGSVHAGTMVALADSACGYGCRATLPAGLAFTTVELKANFVGNVRAGTLVCHASLVHAGRATQVWDATVMPEGSEQPLALFRCTQVTVGRSDQQAPVA